MNEQTRALVSQRTREALADARARGVKLGRPESLDPAVRTRILEERGAGVSYNRIAQGLNRDGVATAQGGKQWWSQTVKGICLASKDPEQ